MKTLFDTVLDYINNNRYLFQNVLWMPDTLAHKYYQGWVGWLGFNGTFNTE